MARRGLLDGPVGPTRECWMARRGLLDGWVGVTPALLNGSARYTRRAVMTAPRTREERGDMPGVGRFEPRVLCFHVMPSEFNTFVTP